MDKKLKVCYYLTKASHIRCVQTIPEYDDIYQIVVGPSFDKDALLSNHYSDINIRKIITSTDIGLQKNIVSSINPDILVVDKFIDISKVFGKRYKTIFLAHGEKYPISQEVFISQHRNKRRFKGFDAYAVGSTFSKDFLTETIGISKDKVFINSMPQIDLAIRKHKVKNSNNKCILLMGHIGTNREDFSDKSVVDFFNILFVLSNISRNLNFTLLVKSRVQPSVVLESRKDAFGKSTKVISKMQEVLNNKNVVFINTRGHIYDIYASSDIVVGHYTSTVEIECICANIPYIRVLGSDDTDEFSIVEKCLAATSDIPSLSLKIEDIIYSTDKFPNNYKVNSANYIHDIGLVLDGLAGKRVTEIIRDMLC